MELMLNEKAYISQFEGDYTKSTEALLQRFPDFLKRVKNMKVMLKPNFWYPLPKGSGSVTDSHLIREVARCLLDSGARKVTVGEGTAVGYAFKFNHTAEEAFEKTGITAALKKMSVDIIDLNAGPFEEVKRDEFLVFDSMRVAKSVMDYDILVNMPVMKTHFRTRVSLSMKNLKGVFSPQDKKLCHKLGLDEGIVDLNRVVRSDFVIVDGICGIEGLWDYPADTVKPNMLVGAVNPLIADMVAATLMAVDPFKVRHLSLARDYKLFDDGNILLNQVPSSHITPFKDPGDVLEERFPQTTLLIKEACTGCYGAVTAPLIRLYNEEKAYLLDDFVIASGPGCESEEYKELLEGDKVVLVGKCTEGLCSEKHLYVDGCPPSHEKVMNTLTFEDD